jgi:hypothetical protein
MEKNLFLIGYYGRFLHSRKIYKEISFEDFFDKANQLTDAEWINIVQTKDGFTPRWKEIKYCSNHKDKYTYELLNDNILCSSEDLDMAQKYETDEEAEYRDSYNRAVIEDLYKKFTSKVNELKL